MVPWVTETQDNRPSAYWEEIDGKLWLILRASSFGGECLFELVATGQGEEQVALPGFMRRAFGEGHKLEPIALERLDKEYGYVEQTAQVEGHLIIPGENIMIRYHPDGVGQFFKPPYDRYGPVGIEVKWMRHDSWKRASEPGNSVADIVREYEWQLSIMMHAEKLTFIWVIGNKGFPPDKDTGIKPYCEDEGKIFLDPITVPPIDLQTIIEKAKKIKELILGEDVLTSGMECSDITQFPCRFLHLRPEPEEDQDEEVGDCVMEVDSDSEDGREMDRLIREYLTFHGQAAEAKARADRAAELILARAPEGTTAISTDRFVAPIQQNTNTSYAWDEMSPELRRAIAPYKRQKKTRRFLTRVKGKG